MRSQRPDMLLNATADAEDYSNLSIATVLMTIENVYLPNTAIREATRPFLHSMHAQLLDDCLRRLISCMTLVSSMGNPEKSVRNESIHA